MLFHLCADTGALGRFDPSLMSDQERMEMLVTPVDGDDNSLKDDQSRLNFKDSDGDFLKVHNWDGVRCDHNDRVVQIDWLLKKWVSGTVSLDFLPPRLVNFDITKGFFDSRKVTGTLSTALLPDSLSYFVIDGNNFDGTLDLSSLPSSMIIFRARSNCFQGNINLESLPSGLKHMDLSTNELTGTLCLTKLPANVHTLSLSRNKFTGTIRLENLPSMKVLNLSDNALVGSPSLANVPAKFGALQLDKNFFEGKDFRNQKVQ